MSSSFPRRSLVALLRWAAWLCVANAGLMAVIGVRYLMFFDLPQGAVAVFYVVTAYVGHFAMLAFIPMLVILPLALLMPRSRVPIAVTIVLGSASLAFVLMDTLVFAENRFHLNPLTVALFEWTTWVFVAVYFLMFLVLESLIAQWIWRRAGVAGGLRRGWFVAAALSASLLVSHAVHAWADANYYAPITSFSRYLPVYVPITAKRFMRKHGLVDLEQSRRRQLLDELGEVSGSDLNYPLHPLRCTPSAQLPNVLLIVVDALRHDLIEPDAMPHLAAFAQDAWRFERHYSGGNSSRMGMFSLFYGLPSTYWHAFQVVKRSPVLIDEFMRNGYHPVILSASSLARPSALDRTAFANIAHLDEPPDADTQPPRQRDADIARAWLDFTARERIEEPFLGFLLFDSAQSSDPPEGYSWDPGGVMMARGIAAGSERGERFGPYAQAVHAIDERLGAVLDDLRERGLDENTLVIVTSDHGEEFDDTGLGYFGHGSNFSDAQVRAPLLMRWPGKDPQTITRRTSHADLAPTLLSELFGCGNPPADYSSGRSLFSAGEWPWLIVGSYHNHAVIEPERTTVTYPLGYFEVLGPDYRPLEKASINPAVIQAALEEMSRFYQ